MSNYGSLFATVFPLRFPRHDHPASRKDRLCVTACVTARLTERSSPQKTRASRFCSGGSCFCAADCDPRSASLFLRNRMTAMTTTLTMIARSLKTVGVLLCISMFNIQRVNDFKFRVAVREADMICGAVRPRLSGLWASLFIDFRRLFASGQIPIGKIFGSCLQVDTLKSSCIVLFLPVC